MLIEVSPGLRKALMEEGEGRINLGCFFRVHAEDASPLLQCYACLGFGHTKKICNLNAPEKTSKDAPSIQITDASADLAQNANARSKPTPRCSHCAGEHQYQECPNWKDASKACCYNCKHSKKFTANTKHSATSNACPIIKEMLKRAKASTDYGF